MTNKGERINNSVKAVGVVLSLSGIDLANDRPNVYGEHAKLACIGRFASPTRLSLTNVNIVRCAKFKPG
jgi:hypothetical protein